MTTTLRTGIDLADTRDVRAAIARYGRRYLDRVFLPAEQDACRRADGTPDPRRLAARFAAKEAAYKVLRPGDAGVPWTAIEVRSLPAGGVGLRWHGPAAVVARAQGLGAVAVSLTTTRGTVSAVAVARLTRTRREGAEMRTPVVTLPAMSTPWDESIRRILADHARLTADAGSVARDADLYAAGMSSHASVNVMLALEEGFDIEFPDELLTRSVFQTIDSIATAVASLKDTA